MGQFEGKLILCSKTVGICENNFSSSDSAFPTAILCPAGAGCHGIFAMIDPKDNITKLDVFYHDETKVTTDQPPCHEFTSRRIIVTNHTFKNSVMADNNTSVYS